MSLVALIVSSIALALTLTREIPLQERTIELAENKTAEMVFDVIPSSGRFDEGIFYTMQRPSDGDIVVDFYVLLWNVGNGSATNISITLRQTPQTLGWYDYHWSTVSIEGFSYNTTSNAASIRVLLPEQQTQVRYHVRFIPSLYDEVQQDENPIIIVEIEYSPAHNLETEHEIRQYIVQIP